MSASFLLVRGRCVVRMVSRSSAHQAYAGRKQPHEPGGVAGHPHEQERRAVRDGEVGRPGGDAATIGRSGSVAANGQRTGHSGKRFGQRPVFRAGTKRRFRQMLTESFTAVTRPLTFRWYANPTPPVRRCAPRGMDVVRSPSSRPPCSPNLCLLVVPAPVAAIASARSASALASRNRDVWRVAAVARYPWIRRRTLCRCCEIPAPSIW